MYHQPVRLSFGLSSFVKVTHIVKVNLLKPLREYTAWPSKARCSNLYGGVFLKNIESLRSLVVESYVEAGFIFKELDLLVGASGTNDEKPFALGKLSNDPFKKTIVRNSNR
jgi:hypothetical protein